MPLSEEGSLRIASILEVSLETFSEAYEGQDPNAEGGNWDSLSALEIAYVAEGELGRSLPVEVSMSISNVLSLRHLLEG